VKAAAASRHVCSTCVQSKQCRTSFPRTLNRAAAAGELLHMDLCGPMGETGAGGEQYVLGVLDDYSRYSIVICLQRKSDAAAALMKLIDNIETVLNCRVRFLRSDRGGEFLSDVFKRYREKKGNGIERGYFMSPLSTTGPTRLHSSA
jgi:Integrase core domain